jgi:hypothetical protein
MLISSGESDFENKAFLRSVVYQANILAVPKVGPSFFFLVHFVLIMIAQLVNETAISSPH